MIGNRDVHIQADRPQIEIEDIVSFVGSPSTIHIVGVPNSIGKWHVESVYVSVLLPDNQVRQIDAVKTGKVWTVTIPSCNVSGNVEDGLIIYADVVDERGESKEGFVLGKTDVAIMTVDRTVSSRTTHGLRLVDTVQEEGDVSIAGGVMKIMTSNGVKQIALT